jgi:hypothetical protein
VITHRLFTPSRHLAAALSACLCLGSCGGSSPTAPSAAPPAASSGQRILLAGQSGAYNLYPFLLPDALADINIDGSVDYWLSGAAFAQRIRERLSAFVWWQGSADVNMAGETYAQKLRAVIALARSNNPGLPVRIVEIADFPVRVNIRAAQREVASDPGVEMIPTADLLCADAACHLTQAGYATVRDRIYRSLGR